MNSFSTKLKHEHLSFKHTSAQWNVPSGQLRWFCCKCIQNDTEAGAHPSGALVSGQPSPLFLLLATLFLCPLSSCVPGIAR